MTKQMNDTEFAEQVLHRLAPAPVPQALENRIMAGFDMVQSQRRRRWHVRLSTTLQTAFPGMRPWQPALALATALMIGGIGGALLPAPTQTTTTASQQMATTQQTETPLPALAMAGDL